MKTSDDSEVESLLPSSRKNPYYGVYDQDDVNVKRSVHTKSYAHEGVHVNHVLDSIDASSFFSMRGPVDCASSLKDYVDSVWNTFCRTRDRIQLERNLLSCGYVSLNTGVALADLRHAIDELDSIEYQIAATSTQAESNKNGQMLTAYAIVDAKLRNQMVEYTRARNRLAGCLRVSSVDRRSKVVTSNKPVPKHVSIHDMPDRKAVFQHLTEVMSILDYVNDRDGLERRALLLGIESRLRSVTTLCELNPVIVDDGLYELCAEVIRRAKIEFPSLEC
jgi:hypothetical protein